MKYLRFILILSILVLALGSFSSDASAQYKFSYVTTINLQNLSATDATVTFTYYHSTGSYGAAGSQANQVTVPMLGNEFRAFTTLPLNPGFRGSVVISSSQEVAAVSNVQGNNLAANASYVGSKDGGSPVYIPLLMKSNYGYDTWFTVQNAGGNTATVNIQYSDGTSTSKSIGAGASETFNQATEAHSLKTFAAVASSTEPLVVTVIEESANVLFAYSGFRNPNTMPVMPIVVENNYGFTTSINLMNTSTTETTATISYTPARAGTACTETLTIPGQQFKTFALAAFTSNNGTTNSNCAKGPLFIGSAKVTANTAGVPLVAVVNEHKLGVNGEAYGSFNPADATAKVVLPLLMDRNYGFFTSANIMNVGDVPVDIFCNLTGTSTKISYSNVAPGSVVNEEQLNKVANGWTGSATCFAYSVGTTTVAPTGKIVGVVNELLNGTKDTLLIYEGINTTP